MRRAAGLLLLALWAPAAGAQVLTATLLGTGTPRPDPARQGQAILLEAGERRLLFDAGRGALLRLRRIGVGAETLDRVFLTHLHFDHTVGLDDVWLTARLWQRPGPLPVAGPEGTAEFVGHLRAAYRADVAARAAHSGLPAAAGRLEGRDLEPGVALRDGELTVTAFAVAHGPVPALGYRIDYAGRSVVISGDTAYTENLVRHAQGADVVIHEVMMASEAMLERNPRLRRVSESHATPAAVARAFREIGPRLGVLVHMLPFGLSEEDALAAVRAGWDGDVRIGRDLMAIDVGEAVHVYQRD